MNTDDYEGHTEGPWADYDAHSVGVKGDARHSDQRIAIMDLKPEADVKQAEHIANRKLIAAAPDLLAEVKRLQKIVDTYDKIKIVSTPNKGDD
jgi:hypothetical protein